MLDRGPCVLQLVGQPRVAIPDQAQEMDRVRVPVLLAGELVLHDFPDGVQHADPGMSGPVRDGDQAVRGQRRQRQRRFAKHSLDVDRVRTARECPEQAEQPPVRLGEPARAPLDRAAQAQVPVGQIHRVAVQIPDLSQHLRRCLGAQPCRGQFQGQRQTVEPTAQRGHRSGVFAGDRETRPDGGSAFDEQPHGRIGGQPRRIITVRSGQWGQRPQMFAPQPQRQPARHQDGQAWASGQQRGNGGGRRGHVLEGVQHQQPSPVTDQRGRIGRTQGFGQRLRDVLGIPQGTQVDAVHGVEAARRLPAGLQREAALADPAGAGDGDQSYRRILDQPEHRGEIVGPADDRGDRRRKCRAGRRPASAGVRWRRCPREAQKRLPLLRRQAKRTGERPQRLALRAPGGTALDVPDRAHADPALFRQLLLRQAAAAPQFCQHLGQRHAQRTSTNPPSWAGIRADPGPAGQYSMTSTEFTPQKHQKDGAAYFTQS